MIHDSKFGISCYGNWKARNWKAGLQTYQVKYWIFFLIFFNFIFLNLKNSTNWFKIIG
jgi:hypothetical protein